MVKKQAKGDRAPIKRPKSPTKRPKSAQSKPRPNSAKSKAKKGDNGKTTAKKPNRRKGVKAKKGTKTKTQHDDFFSLPPLKVKKKLKEITKQRKDAEEKVKVFAKRPKEKSEWEQKLKVLKSKEKTLKIAQSGHTTGVATVLSSVIADVIYHAVLQCHDPPLGKLWLTSRSEYQTRSEDQAWWNEGAYRYPKGYWPVDDNGNYDTITESLTFFHVAAITCDLTWLQYLCEGAPDKVGVPEGRNQDTPLHAACLSLARLSSFARDRRATQLGNQVRASGKEDAKPPKLGEVIANMSAAEGDQEDTEEIEKVANEEQSVHGSEDGSSDDSGSSKENDDCDRLLLRDALGEEVYSTPEDDQSWWRERCREVFRKLVTICRTPVLDSRNRFGETCLHLLAEADEAELVQVLLKSGANATLEDMDKKSPLCCAIASGNVDIAKLLLDHFTVKQLPQEKFISPLLLFDAVSSFDAGNITLEQFQGHLRFLCSECGVSLETKDDVGRTVLHYAAMGQHVTSLCWTLLEYGANPWPIDDYGRSPLDYLSCLNDGVLRDMYTYGATIPKY